MEVKTVRDGHDLHQRNSAGGKIVMGGGEGGGWLRSNEGKFIFNGW